MSTTSLELGRAYVFDYPRHNYHQLPFKIESRRIVVECIRDTCGEPLDRMTISLNPFLQRGRWLVTGRDLDKDGQRSFYVESMKNVRLLTDDELHPLNNAEYVVIRQTHVAYKCQRLDDALKFRSNQHSGVVCSVVYRGPREVDLDRDKVGPYFVD